MNMLFKSSAFSLALGLLLSGCGGGSDSPQPTPTNAALTVSGASDASLNGVYATGTLSLSDVEKINPVGGDPEVCSFRFSGLRGVGSSRLMDGDIRYLPGTSALRVIFVSIAGTEFNSRDTVNAAVDRPNNEIDLNDKLLTASVGGTATLTLTGSVPMKTGRPEGC